MQRSWGTHSIDAVVYSLDISLNEKDKYGNYHPTNFKELITIAILNN